MSILFEPLRIGRMEIANRFVRSATYYGLADGDGRVGDESVELMRTLARGAVGLIFTGYAFVARSGRCFADMNGIDREDQIPGYLRMTGAVHAEGGRIAMQIAHGGSAANQLQREDDERLVVSVTDRHRERRERVREMSEEDIGAIVTAFGRAAGRAEEAGFDGVQIHGAHGYLVSQFLSSSSNRRRDRWGGSPENRRRFALEVVREIRRRVDEDFPVMIKLGCRDYLYGTDGLDEVDGVEQADGLTIDEGTAAAAALEREGVCFVEVSHGTTGQGFHKRTKGKKTAPIGEAYLLSDAQLVRRAISVPLSLVGGMRSLPVMEQVVGSGVADCVSLCRPLIRQPDLVARWRSGDARAAECVSCWGCMKTDRSGRSKIHCRQPPNDDSTLGPRGARA